MLGNIDPETLFLGKAGSAIIVVVGLIAIWNARRCARYQEQARALVTQQLWAVRKLDSWFVALTCLSIGGSMLYMLLGIAHVSARLWIALVGVMFIALLVIPPVRGIILVRISNTQEFDSRANSLAGEED